MLVLTVDMHACGVISGKLLSTCKSAIFTTKQDIQRIRCLPIHLHSLDDTPMDQCIFGYIPNLAFRKRPDDRFPATILLQVHTAKRKIFHDVPGHHTETCRTVLELEDILMACQLKLINQVHESTHVDSATGTGRMKVPENVSKNY